jgi:large conductance mechanosensitive channel
MGFIKEFKEFAAGGSLVDLAAAVVMGAAIGKVITAFIDGMVMPLIGMVVQKDFSNMYIGLTDATKAAAATGTTSLADAQKLGPVFAHGNFISSVVNFLLIALVVFMALKAINKMKKAKEAEAPAAPPADITLLTEIRDALRK